MEYQSKGKVWFLSDDVRPRLTAWLTINRACNLRCNWCYALSGNKNKTVVKNIMQDTMSLANVDLSINFARNLGINSLILIGGEPTVHPHFLEIVSKIKEAGLNVYLVSNIIKFSTKEFLEQAISNGVSSITVSFKGANREIFFQDTGRDYFERAVKALRNVVESGVHYVVNITACENFVSHYEEMISLMAETGADRFSIDTGKPVFTDDGPTMEGMKSPKEMADFFMAVYPKLTASGLRFSVKIAIPFCLFPRDFIDMIIDEGNILTGCQMVGCRGLIIDPNAKILPCNHICDQYLGEIGKDFSDADTFWRFRKNELKDFYESITAYPSKKCQECEYWQMCGAGCKLYWLYYGQEAMLGNFQKISQTV